MKGGEEMANMLNWFPTLNECLESEGLTNTWNCFDYIPYGTSFRWEFVRQGKSYTASIFRETNGMYERPVWYVTSGKNILGGNNGKSNNIN
jgi:hypothetical protein